MVAQENIPSPVATKYSVVLPFIPTKKKGAPLGIHVVPVVLVGGEFEVDLLCESSHWLIASVACDPFVARPPN